MDNIDWQDLLFQFDGRINRAKFWAGIGVIYVALIIAAVLASVMNSAAGWTIYGLVALVDDLRGLSWALMAARDQAQARNHSGIYPAHLLRALVAQTDGIVSAAVLSEVLDHPLLGVPGRDLLGRDTRHDAILLFSTVVLNEYTPRLSGRV